MEEMKEYAISFFEDIKQLIKELREKESITGKNYEEVNLIDAKQLTEELWENEIQLKIEEIDRKTEEFINTYTKKCIDEIEYRKEKLSSINDEKMKLEENLYEFISYESIGMDYSEIGRINNLIEEEENLKKELEEYEEELADFNEIIGNIDISDHSYIDKLEVIVNNIEVKNSTKVMDNESRDNNPNIENSEAGKELEEFFEEMQEYCQISEELKNICRKNPEFANFMFETGDYKEEVLAQFKVNTHEYNEMVNKINEIIEAKKLKDFYEKIEKYYKGFPEEFYKLKELLFQEPIYANAMIDGRDEFYEGVLLSNYYGKPEYDTMRKIINKLIKIGKGLQKQDSKPAIAEQGAKPVKPEQSAESARPEQGAKPVKPEQGTKPVKTKQGTNAIKPEQGTKPAIAEQGAKTARPEQSTKPVKPEQGTNQTKSRQSENIAKIEQSVKPTKAEESTKSGEENEEIHIKSIVLGRKIGIVYDSETTRWNTTLEFSRVKRNLSMTDTNKKYMIEQIMGLAMLWESEDRKMLLQKMDPNFLDALLVAQSNGVNKKEINKIFTNYMLGLAGEKKSQDNIRNVLFYNRNGMEHSKIFTRFIRRKEYKQITNYSVMAEDMYETIPDKKAGVLSRLWQSIRTKRLEAKNESNIDKKMTMGRVGLDEELAETMHNEQREEFMKKMDCRNYVAKGNEERPVGKETKDTSNQIEEGKNSEVTIE